MGFASIIPFSSPIFPMGSLANMRIYLDHEPYNVGPQVEGEILLLLMCLVPFLIAFIVLLLMFVTCWCKIKISPNV